MNTKSNFFTLNNTCCCHYIPRCQACWSIDGFCCHDCWDNECTCDQFDLPKPTPDCQKPDKPQSKPEKDDNHQVTGIQVVLQNSEAPIIEVDENIKFDTILHRIGQGITYNETTGEFTIKRPGNYRINWQVIIGGTHAKRFVDFGVKLNGELYHTFPLPVTTGLLTSELILTTKRPSSVITLFNNTDDRVRLSRHLPNANLVITSV